METNAAAVQLAELVLAMQLATDKGLVAKRLARQVLGIDDHGNAPDLVPIVTNGTLRLVPRNEPVFLVRGQDAVGADTVRDWVKRAAEKGAAADILETAKLHADAMEAWPVKKIPDQTPGHADQA